MIRTLIEDLADEFVECEDGSLQQGARAFLLKDNLLALREIISH